MTRFPSTRGSARAASPSSYPLSTAAGAGLLAALVLLLSGCSEDGARGGEGPSMRASDVMAEARALQGRIITLDTHDDIPLDFGSDEVNPCTELDRQVDIPKMERGGLDVAFFIVYVGQGERTPAGYADAKEQALRKFEGIRRVAGELCPDRVELAYTPGDVERIVGSGKLAIAIGIENGYVIGRDLSLLGTYDELGANYVTLAHGGHNDIADSATPRDDEEPSEHGGLSPFGEEVVRDMNRLGIMVDVSHISKDAALDAMRVSSAPVMASHSSVRALADHPRNMDDETLRALRDNGGVIQIVAFDTYVKVPPDAKREARAALREEMGIRSFRDFGALSDSAREEYERRSAEIEQRWPGADVADFVDHVDYAVDLIGVDHVGISSDFDGGGGVTGWNDAGETVNVTAELLRRGYTDEEIEKIWSGNLLRVWREVEEAAGDAAGDAVTAAGSAEDGGG